MERSVEANTMEKTPFFVDTAENDLCRVSPLPVGQGLSAEFESSSKVCVASPTRSWRLRIMVAQTATAFEYIISSPREARMKPVEEEIC